MRNLERMLIQCSLAPDDESRPLMTERKHFLQRNVLLMKRSKGSVFRFKPKLLACVSCIIIAVFGFYQLTFLSNPIFLRNYLVSPSSWSDQQQLEQCTQKNSVIFLKTHKTAGSTIQNILMRYADNHGLLIAMPLRRNYLGHPWLFKRKFVPRLKPGYSYDILCHHARFNFHEMQHVINENASFVTILRDPAHLFESLYSYYKLNRIFNLTLEDFSDGTRLALALADRRFLRRIGRNQMMFDLGFNERYFDNVDSILMYVRYLGRKFDLVMIAERMMESLVLLRHLLCWEVEDVLSFKHNVRFSKLALEPEIEDGLRELNRADQILYDYFYERLSQQIAEFGVERMKDEVEELKMKMKLWHDFCVEKEVNNARNLSYKYKPYSNQVFGFQLRANIMNSTCENMAKAELPFTTELRRKQIPYYAIGLSTAEKLKETDIDYLSTS